MQADVRHYFASVDHAVLAERLRRRIADGRLLGLLDGLVAHGADAPGRGMPIGSLTSQLFANVYLDALDHFVKERLRVRHYLRYMDDFRLLAADRREARARLDAASAFLADRLLLELNPRRVVVAPVTEPCDLLGWVHRGDGRVRVRRRSVRRLWRRLPALERSVAAREMEADSARASLASWFGLARPADAFRLSQHIFLQRDVDNTGKRLLVRWLQR